MFGKKLAELRKQKKMSQYEMAEKLNFSRGKLANYEQGTREPDYETLKFLANFFNVSIDYLLSNSENTVTWVSLPKNKNLIKDPELKAWYEKLSENEEDLRMLKEIWEIIRFTRGYS